METEMKNEFETKVRDCMAVFEQDIPDEKTAIAMIAETYLKYGPEAIQEAMHRLEMGR